VIIRFIVLVVNRLILSSFSTFVSFYAIEKKKLEFGRMNGPCVILPLNCNLCFELISLYLSFCQGKIMTEEELKTEQPQVKDENDKKGNEPLSLETVVFRLLDKAGRDHRCTLKLLRDKAEKRMSLATGALKPQREEIKQLIMTWWEKEEAKEKQFLRNKLAVLVKLAKASGNAPAIFKGVKELPNDEARIKVLSQK
jgi:hypothetical protein